MKIRTKHNYLMGMLFVLMMMLMLLPTVTFAADATLIQITDGNAYAGTLPAGMTWDNESSTLTLNGYNGGGIKFNNSDDGKIIINLAADSTNTITVADTLFGIEFANINEATFTGSGILNINVIGNNTSHCGIMYTRTTATEYTPKLTFSEESTIIINMNHMEAQGTMIGIDMGYLSFNFSSSTLTIGENATVKINLTSDNNKDKYGMALMGSFEINGTLEINGTHTSSGSATEWMALNTYDESNSSIGANAHIKIDFPNSATYGDIRWVKLTANGGNELDTLGWTYSDDKQEYRGTGFSVIISDECTSPIRYADYAYQPAQMLSFTPTSMAKTYGDINFTNSATNTSTDGGVITYSSDDTDVATVNSSTGEVTIVGVGEAFITATAATVDGKWAETSVSYTLTVNPKPITVTVTTANRKFREENPTFIATVTDSVLVGDDTIEGLGLGLHSEATTTDNVGNYDVIGDGTYNSNYDVTIDGTGKLVVGKADHGDETVSATVRYNNTTVQSIDVSGKIPGDCGIVGEPSIYIPGPTKIASFVYLSSEKALKFNLKSGIAEGDTETVTTTIRTQNYADYDIVATINIIERDIPTGTANDINVIYTGDPIPATTITGTMNVPGTWDWYGSPSITNVADTGVKNVIFTPTDSINYAQFITSIDVEIGKKNPTGTPGYTPITTSGKTLDDAALTVGTITPVGLIKWTGIDDVELPGTTVVTANTSYTWLFTPTDSSNYNTLTGTVVLYARSSSSSRGGGTVKTSTMTIPLSSDTKDINVNVAVSGTTATMSINNSMIKKISDSNFLKDNATLDFTTLDKKIENVNIPAKFLKTIATATNDDKNKNVSVTFKLNTASVTYDAKAINTIAKAATNDDDIILSIKPATDAVLNVAQKDKVKETNKVLGMIDLNITAGDKKIKVFDGGKATIRISMPELELGPKKLRVSRLETDGNQTFFDCAYKDETLEWTTDGHSIYMISYEEPKVNPFTDVKEGDNCYDAVIWAVDEGITEGTNDITFSPDGICTRAQAVTFLWRANGSPAPKTTDMPFNDVPVDSYYYNAVLWAVENSIANGTFEKTFSPNMNCSRAQIVTMLWRMEGSKSTTISNNFDDVRDDAYYVNAVLWATDQEITVGTYTNTFAPNDNCTRAQMVTFIYRDMN